MVKVEYPASMLWIFFGRHFGAFLLMYIHFGDCPASVACVAHDLRINIVSQLRQQERVVVTRQ